MIKDVLAPVMYGCCHRCLFEFLVHTDKPPLRCRNNACKTLNWDNEEQPRQRSHDLAARRTWKAERSA